MKSLKKILEGLKTGVGVGLGIFVILFIGLYITKAALPTANTGDKITASKRNNVISEINSLRTTVTALSSVPAGQVSAFNLSSCPTGWIAANGSNSTPDLRGEFIRGLDGGRGIDSGRTLGSSQESTSLNTIGRYNSDGYIFNTIYNADGYYDATLASKGLVGHAHIIDLSTQSSDLNGMLRHWYYIRPRNVALLYCVKQ